jgi:hypothetical protein
MTLMSWMQESRWRLARKKPEPTSTAFFLCGTGRTDELVSISEVIAGAACLIVLMAITVPFSLGLWHCIEQKYKIFHHNLFQNLSNAGVRSD